MSSVKKFSPMDDTKLGNLFKKLAEKPFKATDDMPLAKKDRELTLFYNESTQVDNSLFLKFKTGGMRAVMGDGFDRINLVTCNMIASTIAKKFKSAVIGFDHRINSDLYAYTIYKVLKAHNLLLNIYRCCTTPYLAWKSLDYDVGIMVTASHNSREYNGFKVYVKGSQVVAPLDQELETLFYKVPFTDIKLDNEIKNYQDNGKRGTEYEAQFKWQKELKKNLSEIEYDAFFKSYRLDDLFKKIPHDRTTDESLQSMESNTKKSKIIFSALNGVSFPFIRKVEDYYGIKFITDSSQNQVDGSFPNLEFPNPEIKDNWLDLLKEHKTKINPCGLSNQNVKHYMFMCDPDGDRFGLAEINDKGLLVYNGNEIAKIYLWFYLNVIKESFGLVNTFLCDDTFKRVAQSQGIPYVNTKTGFKNVSKAVKELKDAHLNTKDSMDFHILAYEDTLGYLFDHSTERDGVKAAILMYHILQLKDISGIFKDLEKFGRIESFTKFLRVDDPKKVLESILNKYMHLPDVASIKRIEKSLGTKHKLLEYETIYDGHILVFDTFKVILRISGTESVLKVYCFSEMLSKESLEATVEEWISTLDY